MRNNRKLVLVSILVLFFAMPVFADEVFSNTQGSNVLVVNTSRFDSHGNIDEAKVEEDGGEEEPCDCGTMAPGECAPCPEEGDNSWVHGE